MSLLNTEAELNRATREKYCLCAFNVDSLEYMPAIVQAAEEEQAPIIMEANEVAIAGMGLKYFAMVARQRAADSSVPVGIHLDHGSSVDSIKACLDAGFTSVMIDASRHPLKDNIRITREVAELARKYGAFSEGEIGHVPALRETSEGPGSQLVYTDSVEAEIFCRESGVQSLAVSIGTVHYMRWEPLQLDFPLLAKIRQAVSVPLVLHGGAAVPDPDMQKAVAQGIVKYNIAYKGYRAYLSGLGQGLRDVKEEVLPGKIFVFPSQVIKAGLESAKNEIRSKIKLLGASGKAKTGAVAG
jgi:fructose-bisphosphate aldolase, class II